MDHAGDSLSIWPTTCGSIPWLLEGCGKWGWRILCNCASVLTPLVLCSLYIVLQGEQPNIEPTRKGVGDAMLRVSSTYRIELSEQVECMKVMHLVLRHVDGVLSAEYGMSGEKVLKPHLDVEVDAAYDHAKTRDRIKELCRSRVVRSNAG